MDRLSTRSPWSAAILVVAVICLGGCETSNDATLLATQLSTTSADTLSQVADAFGKLSGSTAASAVDEKTLERRNCGHIDSTPDGVAYVPYTDEVWVTSPRDNTVWILNAKTLKQKAKLSFPGRPEGYAVDTRRGRFYMNYEDKDLTTAINLKTHKTVAEWRPDCGPDGPHGLQIDQNSGYLFVACSLGAKVLNAGGNGQVLSLITTGSTISIFLRPRTCYTSDPRKTATSRWRAWIPLANSPWLRWFPRTWASATVW